MIFNSWFCKKESTKPRDHFVSTRRHTHVDVFSHLGRWSSYHHECREELGQSNSTLKCLCLIMTVSLTPLHCSKNKTTVAVGLFSAGFLKVLTFQVVPTDGVQAVVHPGEGVNGSLCVHVLLASPHVHYGVVAVEPGNIFSIVNSSCSTTTHSHAYSSGRHTWHHSPWKLFILYLRFYL